jgi:flagellar biogenesis protein FliO
MRRRVAAPLLLAAFVSVGLAWSQPAASGAASAQVSTAIPFRKEATPGFDAGRWALGMGAALAAGALALWWIRRRMPGALPGVLPGARGRRIRVLETQRISPRSLLMLVEVDGCPLLVGEHAGGLVLLRSPSRAPHDVPDELPQGGGA